MTVYDLMEKTRHTEPHFFDRDTLKWFGENLASMKVLKEHATITDYSGIKHDCVVLSKLTRKYPSGPRRTYAYFDATTWTQIFPRN